MHAQDFFFLNISQADYSVDIWPFWDPQFFLCIYHASCMSATMCWNYYWL